jgi:hypothetical protein
MSSPTATPTQAEMNYQMERNSMNIEAANTRTVAGNTSREDEKYRRLWRAWCDEKHFEDGDLVHETKLWYYIHDTLVSVDSEGNLTPRMQIKRGRPAKPGRPI